MVLAQKETHKLMEIRPHTYSYLIFNRVNKKISNMIRNPYSINGAGITG